MVGPRYLAHIWDNSASRVSDIANALLSYGPIRKRWTVASNGTRNLLGFGYRPRRYPLSWISYQFISYLNVTGGGSRARLRIVFPDRAPNGHPSMGWAQRCGSHAPRMYIVRHRERRVVAQWLHAVLTFFLHNIVICFDQWTLESKRTWTNTNYDEMYVNIPSNVTFFEIRIVKLLRNTPFPPRVMTKPQEHLPSLVRRVLSPGKCW